MASCAFVIPGDIDLPTGGYKYDRRVLALLPAHGLDVRHVPLPGSFPAPSATDLATTEATLAALPVDTVLLFDGLAYGAIPAAVLDRIRQPVVALCHHPLAYETGTPPPRAARALGRRACAPPRPLGSRTWRACREQSHCDHLVAPTVAGARRVAADIRWGRRVWTGIVSACGQRRRV